MGKVTKFDDGLHPDEYFNCVCAVCGRRFHDKLSHAKKCKNHYCSKECHREAKKIYMSGDGNHQYGLKGSKNPTWKSDRKLSRYGYIQVRCLDHPYRSKSNFVFEHRLVAEQYLLNENNSVEIDGKRYLKKEYDVHHINFDRMDNRVENLVVLPKREHKKLHNKLNPVTKDGINGRFVHAEMNVIPKRTTETAITPKCVNKEYPVFEIFNDDSLIVIPHRSVGMIITNEAFTIPVGKIGSVFLAKGVNKEDVFNPHNCVKCLDHNEKGAIRFALENDKDEDFVIRPYERIAYIVFQDAVYVELEQVNAL